MDFLILNFSDPQSLIIISLQDTNQSSYKIYSNPDWKNTKRIFYESQR